MKRRLLWELRYRRDEHSIESGIAKGRQFPEWYLDCPELFPFEWRYMRAFWDLRTEAQSGDQTVGRIPWSKARQYGREAMGFFDDMLEPFWLIMSSMDAGFLEWMSNEHARHTRRSDTTKTVGSRSTSKRTYSR